TLGLVQPGGLAGERRLVACSEVSRNGVVLAGEMIVDRALGNAGLRRDRVHARAADSLSIKEGVGRLNDLLSGRTRVSSHGVVVYRPVNIHNGPVRQYSRLFAREKRDDGEALFLGSQSLRGAGADA